jgi:hypothetical protein
MTHSSYAAGACQMLMNDCLIHHHGVHTPPDHTLSRGQRRDGNPPLTSLRSHAVRFCSQGSYSSSSLDSSSSSETAFLAGFFFFFLFLLFDPVDFDSGFSNICRISSSVILWSDFKLPKPGVGGAANLVIPFFVIAMGLCQSGL